MTGAELLSREMARMNREFLDGGPKSVNRTWTVTRDERAAILNEFRWNSDVRPTLDEGVKLETDFGLVTFHVIGE